MRFPFQLSEDKKFDAVGFGTNAVDYLIQVPTYPVFSSKIELKAYTQLAGGEIATTMAGLARLGLRTAYAGRFGDDQEGAFGLQTLIAENVNVDFTERISNAKTQIAFIIIDERSGERTVIWQRDAKLSYPANEAPLELAALGKVLHLTPHDAAACLEMSRVAKRENTVVSIDIDNIFDGIEDLLPTADILISSVEFPERFTGIKDHQAALRELKTRFGCALIGVTLGENGSLMLSENEFIRTIGYQVPNGCKDTTGAGDAFRVGLLYGMLKGETIETSARMANAVAALKCRELGARTALPNKTELSQLLKNQ